MDENELIKLAQKGDINAFEELINKFKNEIYNFAYLKVQDHSIAEDISQETIITIYKKIKTYNFKGKFSNWIYKIAYNTLKKLTEKFTPKNISTEEIENLNLPDTKDFENLEKKLTNTQIIEKIIKIISKLPQHQQEVLILHDIQGRKYEEIVEILDINIGTVKSRLFNARKALKELCEKEKLLDLL